MTALELRHAIVGYPEASVRAAVEAGLRECPLAEAEGDLNFPALVTFWLPDADSFEWSPPPLPPATITAISRHLVASANCRGLHLSPRLFPSACVRLLDDWPMPGYARI